MRHGFLLVLGGAALAVASGCSEDPALYLGGPAGPPTELQLSDSKLTLLVGQSAELGVQPRDAVGNAATAVPAVQIATCDASMVSVTTSGSNSQWAERASVTALALGESCLVVTGASITDTVHVFMGPASARIVGPDTVLSGSPATFGLEFFALDGSTLTAGPAYPAPSVRSLNTLRLPVTQVDQITWDAAGQQPGSVTLRIEADPDFGSVTAEKTVVVAPGAFTGAISATTADIQAGPIVVTPGTVAWDGDETVVMGGYIVDSWDGSSATAREAWYPDSIVFWVPATLAAGTYDLFVLDQGPTQIASVLSFTVTGAPVSNRHAFPGTNTPGVTLEDKPLPLRFPIVHDGGSGTNPLDRTYYTIAPVGFDYQFTALLSFECPGDLDVQFVDGDFTAFLGDRSGETLECPEATVWRVVDGDFNFLRVQNFEAGVLPGQLTLLSGCVEGVENGDGEAVEDLDNWEDSGCD